MEIYHKELTSTSYFPVFDDMYEFSHDYDWQARGYPSFYK